MVECIKNNVSAKFLYNLLEIILRRSPSDNHSFKKAIGQTSPPITFYKKYIISNSFIDFNYFNSTVAPASSNSFLSFSASSLDTPSFTGLGAESTKSLASFNPRPV